MGTFAVSFPTWLAGLRLLFSVLQRPEFRDHLPPILTQRTEKRTPLELSRVDKRAVLLPEAISLTQKWPQRLLDCHRKIPLHASTFIDRRRPQHPMWLFETVQQNFPLHLQRRKTFTRIRIPSRLSAALARRSLNLAPVITRRLNQLQAKHL